MARPRHTERIVYVVGGQLEATVPHEPLHHIPDLQALGNMKLLLPRTDMAPNGAELLQRDELSTEERVWDHQRPLGVSVLRQRGDSWGRGEPGGDGRLRVRLRQGVLSCRSLRAHGHIFSLYFFGSCYVEI